MRKAVGYARVSTEEQTQGVSIEAQIQIIKNFSREMGFNLVKVFKDEGISGLLDASARDGLFSLFKYIEENKVDAVIVFKFDRLARGDHL